MKLKRILPGFILFFGLSVSLQAHEPEVNLRGQKLLVNRHLYGYIIKQGSVWAKDYSFQSSHNEQLVYAKAINREMADGDDYVYYEITFKGYSQKAEMEMEPDFGKRFAYEIAGYDILKNDVLNPEKVEKFLARFPPNISKRVNTNLKK